MNFYSAKAYNGTFILRFDDTNPAKEKLEFFDSIKDDLKVLGIVPDRISHTSDYFDLLQDKMRELIRLGKAYADDTPHEQMKNERFNGVASKHREMTVDDTLKIFEGLLRGENKEWCIRAKIDHTNKNKCLRDPVFYRSKEESHYRFGDKYKA